MDENKLKFLLLHHHPEYLQQCCDMINDEWPRSETARMQSLKSSRDNLPTSLILTDGQDLVLGHCKLTPIPSIPESCYIESVVINKDYRGKKLGTYLMKQVEKYAKEILKLKMLHLSTKGQEIFYSKLGYELCPPISIYGCCTINIDEYKPETSLVCASPNTGFAPPPPPLPMTYKVINNSIKTNRTYMCKDL